MLPRQSPLPAAAVFSAKSSTWAWLDVPAAPAASPALLRCPPPHLFSLPVSPSPISPPPLLPSLLGTSAHARWDADAVCAPAWFASCKLSSAHPEHRVGVLGPKYSWRCRRAAQRSVLSLLLSSQCYTVYPACWRMGSVGFSHWGK